MAINISAWKTKKLDNFSFPYDSLFKSIRTDWHPEVSYEKDGEITIDLMESEIIGIQTDNTITVKSIDISGEGSNSSLKYIFDYCFEQSSGELEAVLIWDDSLIDRLTVNNGVVKYEAIEL